MSPSREHTRSTGEGSRQRWLAAVAYVGPLVLYSMTRRGRSSFLARHCQQAFALLLAEAAIVAFLLIVSNTLGRIPILGFLLEILLELVAFVGLLVVSLVGFVRALAGEEFRLPILDDYADRIPIQPDGPEVPGEDPR